MAEIYPEGFDPNTEQEKEEITETDTARLRQLLEDAKKVRNEKDTGLQRFGDALTAFGGGDAAAQAANRRNSRNSRADAMTNEAQIEQKLREAERKEVELLNAKDPLSEDNVQSRELFAQMFPEVAAKLQASGTWDRLTDDMLEKKFPALQRQAELKMRAAEEAKDRAFKATQTKQNQAFEVAQTEQNQGFQAEQKKLDREARSAETLASLMNKQRTLDAKSTKDQSDKIQGLRKEVQSSDTFKSAQSSARGLDLVKQFQKDPNGFTDYGTLMAVLKAMQGDASVIRESELRAGQNATNIINAGRNALDRALTGKTLQPEQREQIIGAIKLLAESSMNVHLAQIEPIINQANAESLPLDQILGGPSVSTKMQGKSAFDELPEGATIQQNGKTYIKKNGKAVEAINE